MIIADFLPPIPDRRWDYARQMGIRHAIVKLNPSLTGKDAPDTPGILATAKQRFADAGLELIGLEGDQFDMENIKLGRAGRDTDLERYRRMLQHMGACGIPLLCYNFMATIGWFRTRHALVERGGALVSGFDATDLQNAETLGHISETKLWDNYQYFIEAILPTAEQAGVTMALHADDPPMSPLRGIARIFTNADAVAKALAVSDSPSHRLTLCQGTFRAMGEDPAAVIERFADRIAFVHFRDVQGSVPCFRETFHDNGPSDMPALMRLYQNLGISVPIRVDHVPTLAGENNDDPGYTALGRLFAVGYLKGILEAESAKITSRKSLFFAGSVSGSEGPAPRCKSQKLGADRYD